MKEFLVTMLLLLILPSFVQGTEYVCTTTVTDEAGGSAVIKEITKNTTERHIERSQYHFENHYARYEAEMNSYWDYIITGDFENEMVVEDDTVLNEKITGNGFVNIGGVSYQVKVNIYYDTEVSSNWSGWIELNGQRFEVDEELGDIVEEIVADIGEPNPTYHLVSECRKNGRVFFRMESQSFLDPSFCLPATNLFPNYKNCSQYNKTTISLHNAEYDTKDLGLGIVRLNGNITIEMKTEQVNDPNFVFPVTSRLYGILDAEVFGQAYHAEMDFDIVGHFVNLADSDFSPIMPINFKQEKKILKVNGMFIPEEQIPDYMQYIIPLIFMEDEPLWEE